MLRPLDRRKLDTLAVPDNGADRKWKTGRIVSVRKLELMISKSEVYLRLRVVSLEIKIRAGRMKQVDQVHNLVQARSRTVECGKSAEHGSLCRA